MGMGEKFLTFNILLHTRAVPKVIGNWFCTPLKPVFSKKYTVYNCVWIVIGLIN